MAISPYRLIDIERWEVTKEYKLTSHGLSNMQCRQPRNLDSTMAPWDTYFYQPFVACMCRCYLEQTLWRARCFTTWTFGENEETSSRLSQEWSTTSSPTNLLSRRRSSFTFSGQVSSILAPHSAIVTSGVTIGPAGPALQGGAVSGGAKLLENVGHFSENLTVVLAKVCVLG